MATRIREKAEKRFANRDTRPYAKVKYVRMSPSKVRIVLDTVRGKGAEEAVAILANMPQEAAAVGMSFHELCEKIIAISMKRYA